MYPVGGFQLQHQALVDDEIETMMAEERFSIVDWNRLLALERNVTRGHLYTYGSQIDALKPTWPERNVHRKAAVDRFSDYVLKIGRQIRWNSQAHSIFVRFEESSLMRPFTTSSLRALRVFVATVLRTDESPSKKRMNLQRPAVGLDRHRTVSIRSKYLRASVSVTFEDGRNGMAEMIRATGAHDRDRGRKAPDKFHRARSQAAVMRNLDDSNE